MDSSSPLESFLTFGDLLKYLRRRARLTQRELSIAVGYSEAQISRLEQNQRPPDLSALAALFIPALYIDDEPETVSRFMDLAAQARGESLPATGSFTFSRSTQREVLEKVRTIEEDIQSNLPLQLTSFVGREHEILSIANLLDEEHVRSVTLTGSGGCGKTRLALEVSGTSLKTRPDGIWWVELASITEYDLLVQAIALTLGISVTRDAPPAHTLVNYLKKKDLLLVLDNCEQLISATATLAEAVLRACPKVQILVTSREVLGIPGEVRFRVPSLALPAEGMTGTDAVSQFESVRLFVERTRTLLPTFVLTEENASAIARICHRVDGVPLAIELAAARMTMLTAHQIASRLESSFEVLTGGGKNLPRHETLRATMDWSYELLTPSERTLLLTLSVFVGGWTLDAAEAVARSQSVLETLSQLVNKSMVVVDFQAQREARYHLPEIVREYARQRLSQSELMEQIKARHFDFFFDLAVRAEAGYKTHDHQVWLERLDAEKENVRAALEFCVSYGRQEKSLRFVAVLFWYWQTLGYISEGRAHLEKILTGISSQDPGGEPGWIEAFAGALWSDGCLAWIQGNYSIARDQLEKSLQLRRGLNSTDKTGLAISLREIGIVSTYLGELEYAHSALEESIRILQEGGNTWELALAYYNQGLVYEAQNELHMARQNFEKSQSLFRSLKEPWGLSVALFGLGRIAGRQADYIAAKAHLQEALELSQALNDAWSIAGIFYLLGEVSRLQQELEQAARSYTESLRLNQKVGDQAMISFTLHNLGRVAQSQGNLERAVQLFGAAKALRNDPTNTTSWSLTDQQQCEQDIASLGITPGEGMLYKIWKNGETMSIEDAISFALSFSQD